MKRYITQRTNKAGKKTRKSRVKKRRVVERIYGIKYSWKGHKDRNRHKNRMKKEWASSVGLCQTSTITSPPREGEPAGTPVEYTSKTNTHSVVKNLRFLVVLVRELGLIRLTFPLMKTLRYIKKEGSFFYALQLRMLSLLPEVISVYNFCVPS